MRWGPGRGSTAVSGRVHSALAFTLNPGWDSGKRAFLGLFSRRKKSGFAGGTHVLKPHSFEVARWWTDAEGDFALVLATPGQARR
jgi:hypothetical protein